MELASRCFTDIGESLSHGERKSVLPKAGEILIFKAPGNDKGPCCPRLSLHITEDSESIASSIINLVVATTVGAIL